MCRALVLLPVLAVATVPSDASVVTSSELWPAQIVLWNLAGIVVILGHPYLARWWDRRRGRCEEPTRFLTWPACRKVLRHPELPWSTLKRIDQAEARRTIARLEAWQARNVAIVDAWVGGPSRLVSRLRSRFAGRPGQVLGVVHLGGVRVLAGHGRLVVVGSEGAHAPRERPHVHETALYQGAVGEVAAEADPAVEADGSCAVPVLLGATQRG
jgi:hypothetical protein